MLQRGTVQIQPYLSTSASLSATPGAMPDRSRLRALAIKTSTRFFKVGIGRCSNFFGSKSTAARSGSTAAAWLARTARATSVNEDIRSWFRHDSYSSMDRTLEVWHRLPEARLRFRVKGSHHVSISDSRRGSGLPTHALFCLFIRAQYSVQLETYSGGEFGITELRYLLVPQQFQELSKGFCCFG